MKTSPAASEDAKPIEQSPQGFNTTQPTTLHAAPKGGTSAGSTTSLNGHRPLDAQPSRAVEGAISRRANQAPTPIRCALAGFIFRSGQSDPDAHTRVAAADPNHPDSHAWRDTHPRSAVGVQTTLNSHMWVDTQGRNAVEGHTSPQANAMPTPRMRTPAGDTPHPKGNTP
jgi:hypothetical protein